jgi:hypothetical protein
MKDPAPLLKEPAGSSKRVLSFTGWRVTVSARAPVAVRMAPKIRSPPVKRINEGRNERWNDGSIGPPGVCIGLLQQKVGVDGHAGTSPDYHLKVPKYPPDRQLQKR